MKTFKYSLLAAALACGLANAQTAYTTPVGYETLEIDPGFNFVGVRLQQSAIITGQLDSFTLGSPNIVTDTGSGVGDLIGTDRFILEIKDGSGIIQVVTTGTGDDLEIAADLSSLTYPVDYSLRPADSIASIFGAANEAGLAAGNLSPAGADQVWIWNGAGFDQYYFDNFAPPLFAAPGWATTTGAAVDASSIDLIYADGFVVNSTSGNDIIVSGEVKLEPTELNLSAGFNFVGSVSPVGATLASAFGAANEAALAAGNLSPAGADQIWLWNGSAFDQYYFDNFAPPTFAGPGWATTAGVAVDPTTIALDSGYVISSGGGNVTQDVPVSYEALK